MYAAAAFLFHVRDGSAAVEPDVANPRAASAAAKMIVEHVNHFMITGEYQKARTVGAGRARS